MRGRRAARLVAALLAAGPALAAPADAQELPRVHVIATGGTIASDPEGGLSGEALVAALPGLDTLASVSVEEFARVGSSQITPDHWVRLARRIGALFEEDPELSGVVVTHGTDTMEETAFFLHLTVADPRPVVVTGAMRPPRTAGADGPANLRNAVRVAADPAAAGRGTLVLMNDEIHAAAAVTKTNTTRVDAFVSPEAGPLGVADADRIVFGAAPGSRAELAGAFAGVVDGSVELPRVAIGYAYAGADGEALRHLAGGPTRGLVLATVGQGNLPAGQREAAAALARDGMVVVLSSRTNGGRVPVGAVRYGAEGGEAGAAAQGASVGGLFGAGALNAQKARVLLMLALARGDDPEAVARAFRRF